MNGERICYTSNMSTIQRVILTCAILLFALFSVFSYGLYATEAQYECTTPMVKSSGKHVDYQQALKDGLSYEQICSFSQKYGVELYNTPQEQAVKFWISGTIFLIIITAPLLFIWRKNK